MKQIAAKIFKYIIGDWEVFYIFKKKLKQSNQPTDDKAIQYTQKKISDEHYKISIIDNDEEICSVYVIWGDEYKYNFRNYIPLAENEAKIIDVITARKHRGKGYIGKLLIFTEQTMLDKGIDTLLARIWHSNESSKKAFGKSNWEYSGFKLKLNLFHKIPFDFVTYK